MAIEILYFASLRERLGVERESVSLPAGIHDLAGLLGELRARGGVWAEVLSDPQAVLMAVNQEMARAEDAIADGDEIGLFPPVTGG
jgi:molybdopterin synthase sulfur carrier subunit